MRWGNDMPKISIIVPVYNVEPYIKRCMESIISQTYTDFECILIDDGSTDNSSAICDEYAQKDGRFVAIHKQNGGVSSARNTGLDIAKGEYVIFTDPDDYIAEDTLMVAMQQMQEGFDFVSWNYVTVNKSDEVLWNRGYENKLYDISSEKLWLDTVTKEILTNNIGWEIVNKIFKKSRIEENNLRFDTNMKIGEDLYFLLRYLLFSKNIKTIDFDGYFYVIRENSAMHKNVESKINDFVNMNFELYNTIKQNGFSYLAKNYYLIFYMTMNIRYMQAGFEKTLEDIPEIEKIGFYKRFEKKVILNSKEVFSHQNRDTQKGIMTEALYHFAYASGGLWKKLILSLLMR